MPVDDSYTSFFRDCLDEVGEITAPLWTEREIDELLGMGVDGGGMVNPDLPTKLVQAAFQRQTGMKVDFSTAGAASLAVGKASDLSMKEQTHNTITIVKTASVLKSSTTDRLLMAPCYTAEDYNVPVKSLDHAPRPPRTTALDKIAIDERENPVERALANALSAVQGLSSMGADVSELVGWLSAHWGIPYLEELLDKVGFASAEELSTYIAMGGRPAPQIYVSSNVTSQYRPQSKPTVDTESLSNISTFMVRFTMIAKFIAVVHSAVHGIEAPYTWNFHANDAQLSEVKKTTFVGVRFRVNSRASVNPLAYQVSESGSLDEFIGARMPAKHLERVDQMSVFSAASMLISQLPSARTYEAATVKGWIFGGSVPKPITRGRPVSHNFHSKVVTILFAYNSERRGANAALDTYSICLTLAALQVLAPTDKNLVAALSRSTTMAGMRVVRAAINQSEARAAISELDELCKGREPGPLIYYYLLSRYLTLSKPTIESFVKAASDGVMPPYYKAGSMVRGFKFMCDYLAGVVEGKHGTGQELRPYTYLRQHSGAMSHTTYALSIFSEGLRVLMDRDVGLSKIFAEETGSGAEMKKKSTAPVFAKLRSGWKAFYDAKASFCRQALTFVGTMSSEDDEMDARKSMFEAWLWCEYCHYSALGIAYQFYSIGFSGPFTWEGGTILSYKELLSSTRREDLGALVKVASEEHRLAQRNSEVSKAVAKCVLETPKGVNAREVIVERYSSRAIGEAVHRSVRELLEEDHNLVWTELEEPVKLAAKQANEEEEEAPIVDMASALREALGASKKVQAHGGPSWAKKVCTDCLILANVLTPYPALSVVFSDISDNLDGKQREFTAADSKRLLKKFAGQVSVAARFGDVEDVRTFVMGDVMDLAVKVKDRMYANGGSANVFT